MKADFKVFIDACVLANFGVCDLLLRLAERPRLYLPAWSDEVLQETFNTQTKKLGWPVALAESFQKEIRKAFPHASVDNYQHLVPQLANQEKDRHVLAAAITSGCSLILTFNRKDFLQTALDPWKISAARRSTSLSERSSAEAISRKSRKSGSGSNTCIFCTATCFRGSLRTLVPCTRPLWHGPFKAKRGLGHYLC